MFKKYNRTKALVKKQNKAIETPNLPVFKGTIKSALVLLDQNSQELKEAFDNLYLGLNIKSDNVHVLCFEEKIGKKQQRPLDVITPEQFTSKGKIDGTFSPFSPNMSYDLVIAACGRPNLYLNSLVILQPKSFKVGLTANHQQLFHLSVHLKEDESEALIAEILRYLHILKHL